MAPFSTVRSAARFAQRTAAVPSFAPAFVRRGGRVEPRPVRDLLVEGRPADTDATGVCHVRAEEAADREWRRAGSGQRRAEHVLPTTPCHVKVDHEVQPNTSDELGRGTAGLVPRPVGSVGSETARR